MRNGSESNKAWNPPLVSIVIPTFNSAPYLAEALNSVLDQDYPHIEILVIDDGSTDNTTSILEPFFDRIRYFKQPNWGGPSRPRNVGIENASGEFIAFFDSDDIMLPGKVSRSAKVLIDHQDIDFVFTNFQGVDFEGSVFKQNYLAEYRNFRADLEEREFSRVWTLNGDKAFTNLISANFIGTSSVLCRKSVFNVVGLMDENMLNADDANMWSRIAFAGFKFAFLDEVLHSYRKRPGGITSHTGKRYPAILYSISKKLSLDLIPNDRRLLEEKYHRMLLGYGWALHQEKQFSSARLTYRKALGEKISWAGIKGLLRSILGSLI